ncbi:hypothetical protein [Microbacterium sp. SORGH_AS_0421]|uniref:hypothetical protein n=1 Tax=Microbacterium sp. SORGH_AS_0421 TaxID=3041768 RepID=UPI00278D71FE|nr:hypothetical protein [Microbacterium sp. SORGH_AS_0421]MDQ1176213.1 hypothetical protein [Microbacterium sp. SORGH_AS_0421]
MSDLEGRAEEFDDVEVISDGDGLVFVGEPTQVAKFVAASGLPSTSFDIAKLTPSVAAGAAVLNAAADISASAGRWVKLTEESAKAARLLPVVQNSSTKFWHATTRGDKGRFVKNLQFVTKPGSPLAKPGALLTNPAILAGVGGIMAQYAMQQTMEEITDYLAKIDAKVDDVLRAQKDAVLSEMIGVEMLIDEAIVVRDTVGRVSEVTWSKIQNSASTIARTQAYALRQLDAIADRIERTAKIGDLADLAKEAQSSVAEWLSVVAKSFQLQEALGMLELERVLTASPEEIDEHRLALQTARQRRREVIVQTTRSLLTRMDAGAERANAKVLLNPFSAGAVVQARNDVAEGIGEFHARLGLAGQQSAVEARSWVSAAVDVRDDVFEAGADGAQAVGRFGGEALDNARQSAGRWAEKLAKRLQREDDTPDDQGRPPSGAIGS